MSLADTAVRLIAKKGRPVSIRSFTQTVGDPAKPWGSATDSETSSDDSTMGVFIDENAQDLEARLSAVSRLVIAPVEVNGVQVYVAGRDLSAPPTTTDKLVDGSRVMEILKVGTIWDGATPVVYILKVRN